MQVTRALLFQSGLPTYFWGEALLHATFLINRLPTKLLSWKTPFEMLYHKIPNYDVLKVFGCLCFATNNQPHKDKLAPKAITCIYLGFQAGIKGYKLYDLNKKRVFMTRDVIFHETIFPFTDSNFENKATGFPSLPLPLDLQDNSTEDIGCMESGSVSPQEGTTSVSPGPGLPTLRHSTRIKTHPSWLSNFVTSQVLVSNPSDLQVHTVSDAYINFLTNLSSIKEPHSYTIASKSPHWVQAMQDELKALEQNHTWDLTTLPEGKRPIGSRWVYKVKLNADGTMERFTARVVAKGYNQLKGIDYNESFSPVAKIVVVRMFFFVAVVNGWPLQ